MKPGSSSQKATTRNTYRRGLSLSRGFRACYSCGAARFRAGGVDVTMHTFARHALRQLGTVSLLGVLGFPSTGCGGEDNPAHPLPPLSGEAANITPPPTA